jgi:hypothetical protein
METTQRFLVYKIYFLAMAAEGCLALLFIFWEPSEAHSRWLLGYSVPRLLIGAGTAILTLAFIGLTYKAFTDGAWLGRVDAWFEYLAVHRSGLGILAWTCTGLVLLNILFWSGASIDLRRPSKHSSPASPVVGLGHTGNPANTGCACLTSPSTQDLGRAVLVGMLVVIRCPVLAWAGNTVAVNTMEKFTDQSAI